MAEPISIVEREATDALPATKEDMLALAPRKPRDLIDEVEAQLIEHWGNPELMAVLKPVTTSQAKQAGEGSLPACDWKMVAFLIRTAPEGSLLKIQQDWQEVKNATTFALRRRRLLRRQRLERAQQMVDAAASDVFADE